MKTTVCTIITMLELGGAQEVVLHTVSNLDRTRFRPVLLAGPGGLLTEEAKALPGVEVRIVPSLGRPIRPIRDLRALFDLVRVLRQLRPAIVHTHSSKAGIIGRWAAWLAGVPVIVHTVHGFGITPSQPAMLRFLLIGLERLTGLITTHWIVVAQANIEEGVRWRIFNHGQATVIRPGIDPGPFQVPLSSQERDQVRISLGAGQGDLLVGMVACLKPQKAPRDFVDVAVRVCARLPKVRFVLIGDGDLRAAVEDHIRSANVADRVRIVGWRRDIPAVMCALDAFLLTSRWEGLARVLLEARAARVPVVATRVGGTDEAIVDGCHGRLCERGDVNGLADRLCEVLSDAALRERIRNGDELAAEFDIHEMLAQCERLYDKLLASNVRVEAFLKDCREAEEIGFARRGK
ncbi:MAG TPA: glycosyltransferase family 4 protein [Nitrospiraceae bacterium]|jgi:glycosyltransferase involved in cell wall biosynthesis|nr:glycosyltransferase family 4 protein [Nitrospiraceae bacterium]